ncbi:SDR family oxidoreductase [Paraburkholderia sp. BCC1885]|jgi:NAD(P)-dependent dehydrogenase (short-subunit alcohol dehydrogenase family)|uniref:SDR family oxidoreductase n=1 Tax=Paraburkholderia sp. BCC1885 TaxID=2562669 RepID=UPI001181E821|nr:SDR family oxidoreductase [Paraburkholderia sp. BCC1885]
MLKTILITGAGSGFGEGVALGLGEIGHNVIAAAQSWPQVTQLREKVARLGLNTVRVEKLDLLDTYDVAHALGWDFEVLVNNAGIGEGGPIAEIPLHLVRHNFEVNVFAPLQLTQQAVKRWVYAGKRAKVVFVSSVGGLFSPPGFSAYAATKHAIEAMAEAMQQEVQPFGIQVQTINPGAFLTGFNEAMAENAFRWLDDDVNFTKSDALREMYKGLIGNPEGRLDPSEMIARMVEIVSADGGKFRNVVPQFMEERLRKHQAKMWDLRFE